MNTYNISHNHQIATQADWTTHIFLCFNYIDPCWLTAREVSMQPKSTVCRSVSSFDQIAHSYIYNFYYICVFDIEFHARLPFFFLFNDTPTNISNINIAHIKIHPLAVRVIIMCSWILNMHEFCDSMRAKKRTRRTEISMGSDQHDFWMFFFPLHHHIDKEWK